MIAIFTMITSTNKIDRYNKNNAYAIMDVTFEKDNNKR